MAESKIVDVECEIIAETEKAIRVDVGYAREWLAKSLVEVHDDGVVSMPEWLAMERKLI